MELPKEFKKVVADVHQWNRIIDDLNKLILKYKKEKQNLCYYELKYFKAKTTKSIALAAIHDDGDLIGMIDLSAGSIIEFKLYENGKFFYTISLDNCRATIEFEECKEYLEPVEGEEEFLDWKWKED